MSQSYRLKISRPALKLKVAARIPAQLVGGLGIEITKANGVYTFDLNSDDLGDVIDTALTEAIGTTIQAYDEELADIASITFARGDLLYYNGNSLVALPAGTSGNFLKTLGAGADPEWDSMPPGDSYMLASIYAPRIPHYDTVAIATAATIPAAQNFVVTGGHTTVGLGGARYKRVGSPPSHAGKFQSNGGTVDWEIAETVVNPFMFGAVGDGDGNGGGTDDDVALQAAFTVANAIGATVFLPPEIYRCDSALTVPAYLKIEAYGATIDWKTAGNVTGLLFANGGSVSGLTLLGAGNTTLNTSGKAISCTGTNNHPAAPTFVTAPIIRDCTIDEWAGYGISLAYVDRGLITGCKITNIGYAAIGGVSCNDTVVSGNLIDGVTPGTTDAYGIFLDRNDGTSETSDPRSYRCSIINNVVKNVVSVSGDNGQGIDTHGGADFRIIGNTVKDCEVGIFVTGSSISGTQQLGPKRCIIQGNTLSGSTVGYAIMVSGAISGSTVNDYAEGCVVSDNSILGFGITSDGTSGAINAQGTKGLTIRGNTLKYSRCNGIRLNFANIGLQVDGNIIIDPYDSVHTVPACIAILGNDNRGYIGANTFRREDTGVGTYVAIRAITISASLTGLDIEFGRSAFIGAAASVMLYVAGTTTGVHSAGLMMASGRAQISLTNASSSSVAVTHDRFPVTTPRIFFQRAGTPVPGTVTKAPILESASQVATGFTILARPYDLSTFGGAGTLEVDWWVTT